MGTDHKEKLIRVLQILEETDEKSPMNATQILKYLEEEYQIEQVDRRSVYRDIKMLQFCGYEIYQCADKKIYFRTGKLKLCWMQYSRQDAFLQRKQRN